MDKRILGKDLRVSEADETIIRRAHSVCPVTAIQNRYSMMYRDYEKLFPVLEELKIGFVAMPMFAVFGESKIQKK